MKYMLLIYSPESSWTEEERHRCMAASGQVCDELSEKGQLLDASPLQSITMATSVRIREGKPLITDGPFAETTEQLGGYYLIDVPNLEEAVAIAQRLPPVKKGTVEIRPLFDLASLPAPTTSAGAEE